jgi:hypothetical protein
VLAALLDVGSARADPLRLRADAYADASSSPTGVVVLEGEGAPRSWVDAEGLVWAGAKPTMTGDVMVLALRLREPHGYAEGRAGRFVVSTGAVRPVQIDGVEMTLRAPWGSAIESFGGAPVVPRFGPRAYDWLAGGRASQKLGSKVTLGVSYVQRRDDGEISDEEIGGDFAAAPAKWLDLAGTAAYDLTNPGLADARVSAASRWGSLRFEGFAEERSPGRLLPATSLFSVLGDFPSESVGGTVKWYAAPRLDVLGSGAGQSVGGALGGNGWLRATLRLNDKGDRSLGLEVRRVDVSTSEWTGLRGVSAQPLGHGFRLSSEIEVVVPDHPNGPEVLWPWGLMALGWRSSSGWEAATAMEASSTPATRYEVNALLRLSRTWGLP